MPSIMYSCQSCTCIIHNVLIVSHSVYMQYIMYSYLAYCTYVIHYVLMSVFYICPLHPSVSRSNRSVGPIGLLVQSIHRSNRPVGPIGQSVQSVNWSSRSIGLIGQSVQYVRLFQYLTYSVSNILCHFVNNAINIKSFQTVNHL